MVMAEFGFRSFRDPTCIPFVVAAVVKVHDGKCCSQRDVAEPVVAPTLSYYAR